MIHYMYKIFQIVFLSNKNLHLVNNNDYQNTKICYQTVFSIVIKIIVDLRIYTKIYIKTLFYM